MKQKKTAKAKTSFYFALSVFLFLVTTVALFTFWGQQGKLNKKTRVNTASTEMKELTLEDLKKFNGSDPSLPIYIGYEGNIYDVSSGAGFYAAGKTYNYLTGRDATDELNEVGVGEIIKRKYPAVGRIKDK